jgi:hypothetical protein
MNGATHRIRLGHKAAVWLAVGAGLLLLLAANGHFLYVAITSQPDCIDHVRQGERGESRQQLSAAQSACSPR